MEMRGWAQRRRRRLSACGDKGRTKAPLCSPAVVGTMVRGEGTGHLRVTGSAPLRSAEQPVGRTRVQLWLSGHRWVQPDVERISASLLAASRQCCDVDTPYDTTAATGGYAWYSSWSEL